MTREQAIHDLNVIKELFEEQSSASPLCLEYALEVLEKQTIDSNTEGTRNGCKYIRN